MPNLSKRATADLMDRLHLMTATKLLDIVENGVEVLNNEGELVRVTAPASIFAAAIKLLKDNGVTAEMDSERLKGLKEAIELPSFGDDADDFPTLPN